jgi:methionyl-tRNA formyltransferase
LKIVFFGSSDYAVPALKALVEADMAPALVVTKPDAPRGRGRKIYPAEVRLAAEELELVCEQPAEPNSPEFVVRLRELGPDVGVVVSYGVIMATDLLAVPKHGCINAHASLLPLYRGASPIQSAIRDGCKETGVTLIRLVEQLDAGDILLQEKHVIGDRTTAGELRQEMAELSGKVLIRGLNLIQTGKATYTPQDHAKATHAPKIEKAEGVIDWSKPASEIDLLVRAMTPKPGGQTRLGAKRFIVVSGEVEPDQFGLGVTGRIQSAGEEGIRVCTGKDLYRIIRIKPENGRNMTSGEFVRGHPLPPDARFG